MAARVLPPALGVAVPAPGACLARSAPGGDFNDSYTRVQATADRVRTVPLHGRARLALRRSGVAFTATAPASRVTAWPRASCPRRSASRSRHLVRASRAALLGSTLTIHIYAVSSNSRWCAHGATASPRASCPRRSASGSLHLARASRAALRGRSLRFIYTRFQATADGVRTVPLHRAARILPPLGARNRVHGTWRASRAALRGRSLRFIYTRFQATADGVRTVPLHRRARLAPPALDVAFTAPGACLARSAPGGDFNDSYIRGFKQQPIVCARCHCIAQRVAVVLTGAKSGRTACWPLVGWAHRRRDRRDPRQRRRRDRRPRGAGTLSAVTSGGRARASPRARRPMRWRR